MRHSSYPHSTVTNGIRILRPHFDFFDLVWRAKCAPFLEFGECVFPSSFACGYVLCVICDGMGKNGQGIGKNSFIQMDWKFPSMRGADRHELPWEASDRERAYAPTSFWRWIQRNNVGIVFLVIIVSIVTVSCHFLLRCEYSAHDTFKRGRWGHSFSEHEGVQPLSKNQGHQPFREQEKDGIVRAVR